MGYKMILHEVADFFCINSYVFELGKWLRWVARTNKVYGC